MGEVAAVVLAGHHAAPAGPATDAQEYPWPEVVTEITAGAGARCGAAGWLSAAAAPQAGQCAAGRGAGSRQVARPDGRWPRPWCAPDPAGPGRAGPGRARTSALGRDGPAVRARPSKGSGHISELPGEPCERHLCAPSNSMAHYGKNLAAIILPSLRAYRYPVADRLRKGAGGAQLIRPGALSGTFGPLS